MVGKPSSNGRRVLDSVFSLGVAYRGYCAEPVCRHIALDCDGGRKEAAGEASSAVAANAIFVKDFMLKICADVMCLAKPVDLCTMK